MIASELQEGLVEPGTSKGVSFETLFEDNIIIHPRVKGQKHQGSECKLCLKSWSSFQKVRFIDPWEPCPAVLKEERMDLLPIIADNRLS